jgi:hypothetical protein
LSLFHAAPEPPLEEDIPRWRLNLLRPKLWCSHLRRCGVVATIRLVVLLPFDGLIPKCK